MFNRHICTLIFVAVSLSQLLGQGFFVRTSQNCKKQLLTANGSVTCSMDGECRDGNTYYVRIEASAFARNCFFDWLLEAEGFKSGFADDGTINVTTKGTAGSFIFDGGRWADGNGNGEGTPSVNVPCNGA